MTDQHLFNRLGERVGDEAVGSHLEIRIDAEFQGVLAQDAGAGAMNGGYPGGIDLEGLFRKPLGAQRAFVSSTFTRAKSCCCPPDKSYG